MQTDLDKVIKIINQISKDITTMNTSVIKEIVDIKKLFKSLDKRVSEIASKIQEFEVLMDAAELLEEQMEEEESKYNTEWNPYDDDDYEPEDYENYDSEDNDE